MFKIFKVSIILFLSGVLVLLTGTSLMVSASENIISIGTGSYTNSFPEKVGQNNENNTDIPKPKYITDNMKGKAIPTNDWWSSLIWEGASKNEHYVQAAHPFLIKLETRGMRLFTPTENDFWIKENSFGTTMPEDTLEDLVLGNSNSIELEAYLDNYSDWFVTTVMKSKDASMKVSYGHGSPYIYAVYEKGNPVLSFSTIPNISYSSTNNKTLVFSIQDKNYAVFAPEGSSWSGLGSSSITCNLPSDKKYFSIGILPSDDINTLLPLFEKYAYNHITDSKVKWEYRESYSEIITDYKYTVTSFEGKEKGTLFCLYPHQWRNLITDNLLKFSYPSVRGEMKLAEGSSFSTIMKFPGVLNSLPPLENPSAVDKLYSYIDSARNKSFTAAKTNNTEKKLKNLTSLIPLAEQAGHNTAFLEFKRELKKHLENWFNAEVSDYNNLSSIENLFYYNQDWKSLIAYNTSSVSDEKLNDHHSHYGYFIKAAAELARTNKSWAKKSQYGGMVELLIRDIATPNRNDPMFPFLRNFDIYAGHSWSSGHACFANGNYQGAPSEIMNTWAALILWGEYTNNPEIKELGIYLYTTEMQAINEYWLNIYEENHPDKFDKPMTSLVWGCKQDYTGQFIEKSTAKQELTLLPIQAGSLFLEQDFYNHENNILNFSSAADEKVSANTYHWIKNLQRLGRIDHSVIATNHALYAVFKKDNGQRVYTAYNHTDTQKTINFNDGNSLNISPHSWGITIN